MKKGIPIKLLAIVIAISNYISTTSTAYYSVMDKSSVSEKGHSSIDDYMSNEEYIEAKKTLLKFKEELAKYDTDAKTELKDMIVNMDDYFDGEDVNIIRKNMMLSLINDRSLYPGDVDPSYMVDMEIAQNCIAYFKVRGYKLSAELLSRALYKHDSSEFQPSNSIKEGLYHTVAYQSLSNKSKYPNGSVKYGEFKNKFNKYEADAYYAIHGFTANMTNDRIKITDRYDFEESKNYGGVVQEGVNAMVRLNKAGILTYFPVRIHLKR